jgi:hypothetical protein
VNRSGAVAIALWRVRLHQTCIRCLAVAESSLGAAERLGSINRACQQKDARIYLQRGHDALQAVEFIDRLTEPAPRRVYPETAPRRAYPSATPRLAATA